MHNTATYEIAGEVAVHDERCRCGSAFTRVADIQGRNDDVFVYANGIAIHPLVFRSRLGARGNRSASTGVDGLPSEKPCRYRREFRTLD
jgi:hypothetical protein